MTVLFGLGIIAFVLWAAWTLVSTIASAIGWCWTMFGMVGLVCAFVVTDLVNEKR